ncbi:MAG TPA: hypothetical protein PKL73_17165 [Polyangiaceae bacterium]|nr:MAG: hypothetical protein BWY17_03418 [Deltaproteobacteria bacterium ADurb.Bin207]HNS98688.1 hypothetical protein [Polyangiaceae bacterium]HNZ24926.1 hypothetical protein [Polyangiaceae bacterium]HOD24638.1 hypothetical protein [Polyangiaceae bacterium]HOE50485.1 hypothetical protein [Polyangiaceae bacterium]
MENNRKSSVRVANAITLVLLVLLPACKGEERSVEATPEATSAAPAVGCLPGESRLCYCANGGAGSQVCNQDGRSLGPCTCDSKPPEVKREPAPVPVPVPPRPPSASTRPGPWALLIGTDTTFKSATYEAKMAMRDLRRPVAIYRMGGNYRTVVGAYATEQDALDDKPSVIDSMLWRKSRRAAVPRHLTRWCGEAPPLAPLPEDPGFELLYFDCEQ